MSEDQLIHLVRETLRLWAREEMAANPDSDVTYYQRYERYEEMGDQLLENLTAMLSDVEAAAGYE